MKFTPLYFIAKTFLIPIEKILFPTTVRNNEICPKNGRVILCCNHIGLSDSIRLAFTQYRQIFYMGKAELFENKPFGWLLKQLGVFAVQRGKGDRGAINMARDLLEKEAALGIFIEGTRSKTGEFGQPKAGAVMLAYKYHAPILPVCITPIGSKLPRTFHRAVLSYGKPILPEELGIVDGSGVEFRNASRMVMTKIAELREQDQKILSQSAHQME